MRFTLPRPQAKATVKHVYRLMPRCVTNLYLGPRGVETHPLDPRSLSTSQRGVQVMCINTLF